MNQSVILVRHGIGHELSIIKEHIGIDIASEGSVIATLDTQVMAFEGSEATTKKQSISLKGLLGRFSIEEPYLHNAGNDISYTMLAEILLGFFYSFQ